MLNDVEQHLTYLKLSFMMEQYAALATHAAQKAWSHVDYLTRLQGEATLRCDRATKSRIRLARFPVIKTVEQFRWDWPTLVIRLQVQNHFHLAFIQDKANLIFLGGVGLGKNAPGYGARTMPPASKATRCSLPVPLMLLTRWLRPGVLGVSKQALKPYTKPALLILDELGYLPIDKAGADLLFQVISLRYEQGAIIITSNRAFKEWPQRFSIMTAR